MRMQARRARLHVGEHHRPLGMARQRGDQPVKLAAGVEDVLAAERADGALAYPLSLADALHEVEISMTAGDLLADEHGDVVSGTDANIKSHPHKLQNCFHYTFRDPTKPAPGIERFQRLGKPGPPQIRGLLLKLGLSQLRDPGVGGLPCVPRPGLFHGRGRKGEVRASSNPHEQRQLRMTRVSRRAE